MALSKLGITKHLDSVLDVRTNGTDIEIDYSPNGDALQVLKVEGLVLGPDRKRLPLRHGPPIPIHRDTLLTVEDLGPRLLTNLQQQPEDLLKLHWRTFERLVAELLEGMGWDILELTRGSKDGGLDIYAALPTADGGSKLVVIDAKRYRKDRIIGVDLVRSVAGLKLQHKADIGMLVTTTYFSKDARDLEQLQLGGHVRLEDLDAVSEWLSGHRWKRNGGLYLPESRFSARAMGESDDDHRSS